MQFTQTVSMAFKAISGNKVRAFLTMLGVIIGVMSVIVLIAIGQGTTASVTESISSMGTNLLTVSIQTRRVGGFGGFGGGSSSSKGILVILKLEDILALGDDESIQYVSPTTSGSLTVKGGQHQYERNRHGRASRLCKHRQSGRGSPVDISSMRTWITAARSASSVRSWRKTFSARRMS